MHATSMLYVALNIIFVIMIGVCWLRFSFLLLQLVESEQDLKKLTFCILFIVCYFEGHA